MARCMITVEITHMTDDRRGLLTPREREILSGEADVVDSYYYSVVSRVRKKIQKVEEDAEILRKNHPSLYLEFQATVSEEDSNGVDEGTDE